MIPTLIIAIVIARVHVYGRNARSKLRDTEMTDLHWLAATLVMTALFWMPYVVARIGRLGLLTALGNPNVDVDPPHGWTHRAKAAHQNGVENLVLFAPLLLIAHVLDLSGQTTTMLAMVYFFARLAHFVVYTFGIPVLRTLAFTAGWVATIGVGGVVFGLLG